MPSMVHIIGVVSLTMFLLLGTTAISSETLIERNNKTAEARTNKYLNYLSKSFRLLGEALGESVTGSYQQCIVET